MPVRLEGFLERHRSDRPVQLPLPLREPRGSPLPTKQTQTADVTYVTHKMNRSRPNPDHHA